MYIYCKSLYLYKTVLLSVQRTLNYQNLPKQTKKRRCYIYIVFIDETHLKAMFPHCQWLVKHFVLNNNFIWK